MHKSRHFGYFNRVTHHYCRCCLENVDLFVQDFTLSVQPTPTYRKRTIPKNLCDGNVIDSGSAELTAVFAFCNLALRSKFPTQSSRTIVFPKNQFAQNVTIFDNENHIQSSSYTRFVVIVPNLDHHLVVPYTAKNELETNAEKSAVEEIESHGCFVQKTGLGEFKSF